MSHCKTRRAVRPCPLLRHSRPSRLEYCNMMGSSKKRLMGKSSFRLKLAKRRASALADASRSGFLCVCVCQLILWALRFRVDAPHLKTTHTYQHLTARSPTGQPVFGPNTQTSSHRRLGFGATSDRRFTETTVSQQRLARSHLMPSRKRTGPCPGPEPTAPGGDASGATALQMGQPGGPSDPATE